MITVYHRDLNRARREARLKFIEAVQAVGYGRSNQLPIVSLADYVQVAQVDTNELETAYRVVHDQSDRPWQQHPLVRWAAPPPQKCGTDIGDLLIDGSGNWYLVAPIGFLPVEPSPAAQSKQHEEIMTQTQHYVELGPSPVEEDCAQVGKDNYPEQSVRECKAFQNQLERVFPIPDPLKEACSYGIKTSRHDYGTYREVVLYYEPTNPEAVDFACEVEGKAPMKWDEAAQQELNLAV